jgi:tRNA (mo5U34)-methyltransferase
MGRKRRLTREHTMKLMKRITSFPRRVFPPSAEPLRGQVAKIRWFQQIDLGNGIITPGAEHSAGKLEVLGLPDDLRGWSVLDVGAWDGYFSFAAERRGAREVLATDHYCWGGGGWGTKAGFDLARKALRSKVQDKRIDVLDHSPETVGVFDLVLFLSVLYHMRHPLLALEKMASVTRKLLILETHVDMLDCPRPAMAFYPGDELCHDASNWCGPNPAMLDAMLKTVGFRKVVIHCGPLNLHTPSPRIVFHAWK